MSQQKDDPSELPPRLRYAMQLVTALCDDRITAEQFRELESLVCDDHEVRRFYVQMMHLDAGLYYFASAMPDMVDRPTRIDEEINDAPDAGMNETMMLPAMREAIDDDGEEFEEISLPWSTIQPVPKRSDLRPSVIKGGIAALITIGLGLLAYFLPGMGAKPIDDYSLAMVKPPWFVAWMDLGAKPVWEFSPQHQAGFVAGESMLLRSGAVQLRLRHNGRLVVEGPADLRFISDMELQVNRGRIVATFPGGGLTVRCPTGSIVDLGTQFGISVDPSAGSTEVEVFRGRVSASLASAATTQPATPLLLTVGQAAEMSKTSLQKNPQGAIPQRYICNLQNDQVDSLDVTDLVSGGDGTTHRRGIAVDSTTGDIGVFPPVGLRMGDRKYHAVHGFPVVDGTFVPDGTAGPTTVDSAGHKFQFPSTTSQTTNQIWTGGQIPWPDELGISTVLAGVDYASPDHAIICTHANNALTLDLNSVRRLYPGRLVTKFHCHFANSYVNGIKGAAKMNPTASVYVLVDGMSRYQKVNFSNQDGPFAIDLPISRTDRFMTLAAVDDGKEIDRDWILWTDARLQMTRGD